MITLLDDGIGRILDTLDETGLARNTVVAFLSDHGDYLGDYGLVGKGFHYDCILRTPLLLAGPGIEAARLDGMASVVDIAPTLLDFAGVAEPEGMQGLSMKTSLVGDAPLPRTAALTENDDDFAPMRARTLTTPDWKLTRYLNRPWGELYDRRDDPRETRNRWDDPACAEIRRALTERLLDEVTCAVDMANGRHQRPAAAVPKWLPGNPPIYADGEG